jgi:uncharacterized protein (DUF433 family)
LITWYSDVILEKENFMSSRSTIDPTGCHGKPTIRGYRLLVTTVLEQLAGGASTWSELREDYPAIETEGIQACEEYAVLAA